MRKHSSSVSLFTGELIKKIRLLNGVNQKGMAMKMGITQQAYSKLEKRSQITAKKCKEILNILNYTESELMALSILLNGSDSSTSL